MNKPLLIIVNGQPGTGKTTLSRKIAKQLNALDYNSIEAAIRAITERP